MKNTNTRTNTLTKSFATLLIGIILFSNLSIAQTYCTPDYTFTDFSHNISKVEIGSFEHEPSYNSHDYTSEYIEVESGAEIPVTLTSVGWCGVGIAVDWDGEGDFTGADDILGLPEYMAGDPQAYEFDITIPAGTVSGDYRLRVWNRVANSGGAGDGDDACGSFNYGSWADYTIRVLEDCEGDPDAGTINDGEPMEICENIDFSLTATGATIGSGMNYQWQEKIDGEWEDIQGAENTTLHLDDGISEEKEYRFTLECLDSGSSDTSEPITVSIKPASECYCIPGSATSYYIEEFNTSGGVDNIDKNTSSTSGYEDYTETDEVSQAQTLSFGFYAKATGISVGMKIWVDWNQDGQFTNDEVAYQSSGYETTFEGEIEVPLNAEEGTTRMRIGVDYLGMNGPSSPCSEGVYTSFQDYALEVLEAPSCIPPSNIEASEIQSTTASISWEEINEANEWELEYGEEGFEQGEGTLISNISENPYLLEGLNPNTTYTFYVKSNCDEDDDSFWGGPVSFTTECATFEANGFCENFDTEESESIDCWTILNENQDSDTWQFSGNSPHSGNASAMINTDFNNGNNDDYLISPKLNLTGIEAMQFYYKVQSEFEPNDFEVLLSTTGTNPEDFTDTLMGNNIYSNTTYEDTIVDLTAYEGEVYIAFHVTQGGEDGWMLFIDDICFAECIPTPGVNGSMDVCRNQNMMVLSDGLIENNNTTGHWEYPPNPYVLSEDTLALDNLTSGEHELLYIVDGLCESDTTVGIVNIVEGVSAGIGSSITVCKNEPINLFASLEGNVNHGGVWYNYMSEEIEGTSLPHAPKVGGEYNYTYIVNDEICGADTAVVTVIVDASCDYLSTSSEELKDMQFYPNPTAHQITIENPSHISNLKVEIIDANGRIVMSNNSGIKAEQTTTISVNQLERGVYTLRVFNDEYQRIFKLIKE